MSYQCVQISEPDWSPNVPLAMCKSYLSAGRGKLLELLIKYIFISSFWIFILEEFSDVCNVFVFLHIFISFPLYAYTCNVYAIIAQIFLTNGIRDHNSLGLLAQSTGILMMNNTWLLMLVPFTTKWGEEYTNRQPQYNLARWILPRRIQEDFIKERAFEQGYLADKWKHLSLNFT